jgi:hypothetical protein
MSIWKFNVLLIFCLNEKLGGKNKTYKKFKDVYISIFLILNSFEQIF